MQILYGRAKECHNEIMQTFLCTHSKRKLLRTKTTKLRVIESREQALSYPTVVINLIELTFK